MSNGMDKFEICSLLSQILKNLVDQLDSLKPFSSQTLTSNKEPKTRTTISQNTLQQKRASSNIVFLIEKIQMEISFISKNVLLRDYKTLNKLVLEKKIFLEEKLRFEEQEIRKFIEELDQLELDLDECL